MTTVNVHESLCSCITGLNVSDTFSEFRRVPCTCMHCGGKFFAHLQSDMARYCAACRMQYVYAAHGRDVFHDIEPIPRYPKRRVRIVAPKNQVPR